MTIRVGKKYFSGTSQVFDTGPNGLTSVVRSLSQQLARSVAGQVTDLTDNSGGAAADGTIGAITNFTPAVLGAADCTAKAELEAAFGGVRDALSEVIAQLNAIRAKVPAFDALTDETGGGAADGTIGAIDVSMTAAGASLASAAGANTVLTTLRDRIAQAAVFVNKVAVACGLTPLVDNSGGTKSYDGVFAAVSTDTGATVSGADTTTANAAIKAADADARMAELAAAVKELATKLNEATGSQTLPAMTVVAVD